MRAKWGSYMLMLFREAPSVAGFETIALHNPFPHGAWRISLGVPDLASNLRAYRHPELHPGNSVPRVASIQSSNEAGFRPYGYPPPRPRILRAPCAYLTSRTQAISPVLFWRRQTALPGDAWRSPT